MLALEIACCTIIAAFAALMVFTLVEELGLFKRRKKLAAILLTLRDTPEGLRAYDIHLRNQRLIGPMEVYRLMRLLERRGDVVSSEVVTAAFAFRGHRPVIIYRLAEKHR